MNLVRVERTGRRLLAGSPTLFGELRRTAAGEMYRSKLRGWLARLLAEHAPGGRHRSPAHRGACAVGAGLRPAAGPATVP